MQRAISLARQSPDTRPNPRVGCVLLGADGFPIAEGAHQGAGQPHAEVVALRAAGDRAAGATAVVSLEPCNHTGRTGPCAHALIEAGVARVVYGQSDPNPAAAGGAAALRAAGIETVGGVLAAEAESVNPVWTFAMTAGRPLVTWKTAATLDGLVAAADGTSKWITGPAARQDVHRLRAASDAVMVGTGTVLADDPELTVRLADQPVRQPLRVVMGQRAVPATARVRTAGPMDAFLPITTRDPKQALAVLQRRGAHGVLLEGGPLLARSFLRAGLVDRIVWYVAPALLGSGREAVPSLGITTIGDAARFVVTGVRQVGDDVRIDVEPVRRQEGR
jgi:diaminohydroxyphosphoribosylaminopyrimidine deaminase/5-amino-6-(5-phosphoribosylamino)uracil reductase